VVTSEAGILLITKDLKTYLGNSVANAALSCRPSLDRVVFSQHRRSNEAGMFLIAEDLRIYLRSSAGGGPRVQARRVADQFCALRVANHSRPGIL